MSSARVFLAAPLIAGALISDSRVQSATVPCANRVEHPGFTLCDGWVQTDKAAQWTSWLGPKHAIAIDSQTDSVAPRHTRTFTNAVADAHQFRNKIGEDRDLDALLKALEREGVTIPLNLVSAPATVDGLPIVYAKANSAKNIEIDDPIIWHYYQGGIRNAPTNHQTASNILDGDPDTFWEPSSAVTRAEYDALPEADRGPINYIITDDAGQERLVDREMYDQTDHTRRRIQYNSKSLDKWYVDVDLGRVVPASMIVLRFVDEDRGEPFRQVRIFSTPSNLRDKPLSLTARTAVANLDQRVVEFDLDGKDGGGFQLIHLMRIAVTESKLDRLGQVPKEEYLTLPLEEQGGVDYHIVNAAGGQTRVSKEIFDQVGPDRQGDLAYYRRERPRLADVEVWTEGDNIALGILEGGGSVELDPTFPGDAGFDGLYETRYRQRQRIASSALWADVGQLTVDLGANFRINSYRVVGARDNIDDGLIITEASDGSLDPSGELEWKEIGRNQKASGRLGESGYTVLDPPVEARFLRSEIISQQPLRAGQNNGNLIGEFQLFGEGFPARVDLVSPVIELPQNVILGAIEWEADIPDSTLVDVQIRTRTGDRLAEVTQYYKQSGDVTDQKTWERDEAVGRNGPVSTTKIPGGGWSSWSRRYLQSGDRVTSPSPRRFVQIQASLISRSPSVAGEIRSVRLHLSSPLARQTIAEVWPDNVPIGTLQDFEVYLKPTFTEGQPSRFDEILLDPSPISTIDLSEVSLGSEEELESGSARHFAQVAWHTDPETGTQSRWFPDESGGRFQGLVSTESGDTLKIVEGSALVAGAGAAARLLRLPGEVALLPALEGSRIYNRITAEGDEVPVDDDLQPLTELDYLVLPQDQLGQVLYFEIVDTESDGTPVQEAVTEFQYRELEESAQGDVRYFRRLVGSGGEFPFDEDGNALTASVYQRLPFNRRGSVLAAGQLLRLRFRARVLLSGTTIDALIRSSAEPDKWQPVDAGDATALSPGTGMTISAPFSSQLVRDLTVTPNPFTPNGDGTNDETVITFSIGNLNAHREIRVQIYDLSGRLVYDDRRTSFGDQSIAWRGVDDRGRMVPPGLYLCQVEVDADAETASNATDQRVVAVVY